MKNHALLITKKKNEDIIRVGIEVISSTCSKAIQSPGQDEYFTNTPQTFPIRNPITQSPNHPITQSPNHPITQSPNHPITQSPNYPINQSPNQQIKSTQAPSPTLPSPLPQPTAGPQRNHNTHSHDQTSYSTQKKPPPKNQKREKKEKPHQSYSFIQCIHISHDIFLTIYIIYNIANYDAHPIPSMTTPLSSQIDDTHTMQLYISPSPPFLLTSQNDDASTYPSFPFPSLSMQTAMQTKPPSKRPATLSGISICNHLCSKK